MKKQSSSNCKIGIRVVQDEDGIQWYIMPNPIPKMRKKIKLGKLGGR
jgi:hypothetical protein